MVEKTGHDEEHALPRSIILYGIVIVVRRRVGSTLRNPVFLLHLLIVIVLVLDGGEVRTRRRERVTVVRIIWWTTNSM